MGPEHYFLLFATLATPTLQAGDLELKPATLKTWDEYVHKQTSALQRRANGPGGTGPFLWMDENADRVPRVRGGEVVVWPAGEPSPKRVPSGLIHDWIGAAFIPGVRIGDILSVVRNYSRYKEVYKPGVLDAKLLKQSGGDDRFSMLLRNASFFSRTALDSDYDSSYTQVDATRWYSVSNSTRVQEIDNYGQPGEHKLPPDEGHGYVWRMCTLSQLEERDGGVYVDEELMVLSRDLPGAVRWMAGPIIRRVARESLAASIEKTRSAVGTRAQLANVAERTGGSSNSGVCARVGAAGCLR